jgi:cell division septation protein DedD
VLLNLGSEETEPEAFNDLHLKSLLKDAKKDLDETFQNDVVFQLDEQEMRDLDPDGLPLGGNDKTIAIEDDVLRAFDLEQVPNGARNAGVCAADPSPAAAAEPEKPRPDTAFTRCGRPRRRAVVWMLIGIAAVATALVSLRDTKVFEITAARYGGRLLERTAVLLTEAAERLPVRLRPAGQLSRTGGHVPDHSAEPEQPDVEIYFSTEVDTKPLSDEPAKPAAVESSAAQTPAPKPAGIAADGGHAVHTDSFKSRFNAEKELERLQRLGYAGYLDQATIPGRGVWFRIMVGPFSSRDEAREVLEQLKSAGKRHPVIMVHPHEP